MRQKIENKIHIAVDGVDLTTLKKIEFYVRQLNLFFQYTPDVLDAHNMMIVIPKEDADMLATGSVKLQFAYTDSSGNDDASDIAEVSVEELLKGEGYNAD